MVQDDAVAGHGDAAEAAIKFLKEAAVKHKLLRPLHRELWFELLADWVSWKIVWPVQVALPAGHW